MVSQRRRLQIHGQLPAAQQAAQRPRRPSLLHGGPRRQLLLRRAYIYYNLNAYALNNTLPNSDQPVLSINYRSGTVRFDLIPRAPNYELPRSDYNDVQAAANYLGRAPMSTPRIGAWAILRRDLHRHALASRFRSLPRRSRFPRRAPIGQPS